MADPQPPQQAARIAQQDEADLVARAVAGDRPAFGILVKRYAGVARRVAGGLRRAITSTAALAFAGIGVLLLVFPRVMALVLAAGAFSLALAFGLYTFERRRTRHADDG